MQTIQSISQMIRQLRQDERGASAIEYGLIVAGVSVVIVAAVGGLGTDLSTFFSGLAAKLDLK